jgi:hypothetical protein
MVWENYNVSRIWKPEQRDIWKPRSFVSHSRSRLPWSRDQQLFIRVIKVVFRNHIVIHIHNIYICIYIYIIYGDPPNYLFHMTLGLGKSHFTNDFGAPIRPGFWLSPKGPWMESKAADPLAPSQGLVHGISWRKWGYGSPGKPSKFI